MDFREVDRRYADLKQQYDNGNLSAEEFDAQREQMMVQDDEGRWWAKSRETGDWNYYDGNTWVRDTPPDPTYHTYSAANGSMTQTSAEQPRRSPPRPEQEQVPVRERPGLWIACGIVASISGISIIPFPLSWDFISVTEQGRRVGRAAVQL
jgi:hypothetical protein